MNKLFSKEPSEELARIYAEKKKVRHDNLTLASRLTPAERAEKERAKIRQRFQEMQNKPAQLVAGLQENSWDTQWTK